MGWGSLAFEPADEGKGVKSINAGISFKGGITHIQKYIEKLIKIIFHKSSEAQQAVYRLLDASY
jgi:hypothetical protein